MRLRPLSTKLLRDLWRLRAQSLAIALVIAAGVGMMVMSFGMIRSLELTRQSYYDQYRFADVFAPLKRAPESLMRQVRAIPGVASADDRVTAAAVLDVPGIVEPVSARVHSLPVDGGLNQLVLRSGRLPRPGSATEVMANEAFAKAARLPLGSQFSAVIYGKNIRLRLVGTVISPEYVYAVAPGEIFPDNRRYGILWMNRDALGGALNLRDAFNEVLVELAPGADRQEVIAVLDRRLAPWGAAGAYGRNLQISDRFVSNEIDQLSTMVEILPPIFLVVAAFLLNIVLARLVDTEREVIGLLKAFGYRDRTIMGYYARLAVLLSLAGLVLGSLLGWWLGRGLAGMYQRYFVFPFLRFDAGVAGYLAGFGATLIAVLAGSLFAVRRAARLTPADAMRPPTPTDYSGTARLAAAAPDEPSRMVLRNLLRRPLRSALTVLGVASALALYIASASTRDNVDRMVDLTFGQAERADLTVTFAEPRDERALHELRRMAGVWRAEPFRVVGATLLSEHGSVREALSGGLSRSELSRVVDMEGRVIEPRPTGAIISSRLAAKLRVEAGDLVVARVTEGRRPTVSLRIDRVVDSPLGSSARLDADALNRLLKEGASLSGAYLVIDPRRRDAIFRELKSIPQVAAVTSQDAIRRGIEDTIAEQMGIVTLFNSGFAALIVIGVVYNSARVSLSEHARDLASMRVLGFHKGEVSFVLLGELGLVVLAALPPGILLGIALSRFVTEQFSADLYTIPYGYNPATFAEGVLMVLFAAAGTALLLRSRTDRLDLVRALKTRE